MIGLEHENSILINAIIPNETIRFPHELIQYLDGGAKSSTTTLTLAIIKKL